MARSVFFAAVVAVWATACTVASPALADCQLGLVAEFHVDPKASVPIADGEINGHPVKVLIDTGSTFTSVVASQAIALKLPAFHNHTIESYGVGGERAGFEVTIQSLKVGQLEARNLHFITVGSPSEASDVAIILGNDILSRYDVEFDMADGYIRLLKPQGCSPDQLVYWNKPYSQADLVASDRDSPVVMATALLNGKRQPVQIDSGADVTIVDEHVASNLGVRRGGAGEVHIEGLGPQDRAGWIGQFDSFALGDEQIAHPRLTVIKLAQDTVDNGGAYMVPKSLDGNTPPTMLIGADFIRAHHLLIGVQEHVLVFSYSGGPIFSAPAAPPAAK